MAMPRRTDVDDYYEQLPPVARPHLTRCANSAVRSHPGLARNSSVISRTEIDAAGYDAGSGMIKFPYDRELPVEVLTLLMTARLEEYEATGAKW